MYVWTWMMACQESPPPGHHPAEPGTTASDGDLEALEEVVAAFAKYADLNVLNAETVVDEQGCPAPRWLGTTFVAWDNAVDTPTYGAVHGVRVVDTTHDSRLEPREDEPAMLLYHLDEEGLWRLTGLEWGFASEEDLAAPPNLFGVPMLGASGGRSYDLSGFFWLTKRDLEHGFDDGWANGDLHVPDWYRDMEDAIFGSALYYDPSAREPFGFVQRSDGCVTSAAGDVGYLVTNPDLVGRLDTVVPDTLVVDADDRLLAVQWTWPARRGPPPTMFGRPMSGPDADGNHVFRFWMTDVPNPNGALAETHPAFSCDAPPPPDGCAPSRF